MVVDKLVGQRKFTYKEAGVDRELRASSKKALSFLAKTYGLNPYGRVIQLPYGNVFPFGDEYLDLCIEGVGTKVLLAQLANKYDTIGIDSVAMAVNDVLRSGARPVAIVDNVHVQVSDPALVEDLIKSVTKGAIEAGCVVPGGEIGDVAEVVRGVTEGKGFDLVVACLGELTSRKMIYGNDLKPEDVVIGLRSSGIHSNGISLARKVLFKQWGGKYDPYDMPGNLNRELIYEVLEPTRIYVKPVLRVAEKVKLKGAVHVTGDAYLKFDRLMKFSKGVGFEFDNFKPQQIFELIPKTAKALGGTVTDDEMFRTFNMGWGFALIVAKEDVDNALEYANKSGVEAEPIGRVTRKSGRIVVFWREKKLTLK